MLDRWIFTVPPGDEHPLPYSQALCRGLRRLRGQALLQLGADLGEDIDRLKDKD